MSAPLLTDQAEWYGLTEEQILERIEDGESLASIAASKGKVRSMLSKWIAADENRSARARTSRELAASAWDEKAESGIAEATDPFDLAKAKELAHHYRWRSSKISPAQYGDKLDMNVKGSMAVTLQSSDDAL